MSASFPMDRICGLGSRAPLLQPPYFADKGSGDLPKFILPAEGTRLLTCMPLSGLSCSLQPISSQREEACLKPAHIQHLWKLSHSFSQRCWHFCDSERLKAAETWQSHNSLTCFLCVQLRLPAPPPGPRRPDSVRWTKKTGEVSKERQPKSELQNCADRAKKARCQADTV